LLKRGRLISATELFPLLYNTKGEILAIKENKLAELSILNVEKPKTSIKALIIFQSSLESPTLNKTFLVFCTIPSILLYKELFSINDVLGSTILDKAALTSP